MKIADQIFCKEDKEDWKRSSKDCSNGTAMAIPDGNYEYTMEPDPNDASRKIYWRRATFVDPGHAERDAARLKFIEIKITADDNGIVEYIETRRGGIEPDGWSSTQVTRYEYDPKDLKIDTPSNRL